MDWQSLRTDIPATREWAFLDHAGVSPLPGPTVKAMTECLTDIAAKGSPAVGRWARRADEVRGQVADLIGTTPGEIAFTKNTGEGLVMVAEGYPWRPGDNVVVPAEEYPSNQYVWMNLADRGVEVRRVPSRGSRILIDDLRDAMNARTRLLTVSFVEYGSGFRNDMFALGSMCRERGVHFCVDAIQGLGVLPLDVSQAPIDFLACGGHKWLLGPQGVGFFFVRRELIDFLHVIGFGALSVRDPFDFENIDFTPNATAQRWEGGTLNYAGIAGLGASLAWLAKVGGKKMGERVFHLTDYLCESAERKGVPVYSNRAWGEWSGIVALDPPGGDYPALVKRCREAKIVVSHRGGHIRAAPHCYNTEDELDRLVEVLCH